MDYLFHRCQDIQQSAEYCLVIKTKNFPDYSQKLFNLLYLGAKRASK